MTFDEWWNNPREYPINWERPTSFWSRLCSDADKEFARHTFAAGRRAGLLQALDAARGRREIARESLGDHSDQGSAGFNQDLGEMDGLGYLIDELLEMLGGESAPARSPEKDE